MKIKHLVQKACETTHPYAGVRSIGERFRNNPFLVVTDNGTYVGILTPSDIVEAPHQLVVDCIRPKPRLDFEQDIESTLGLMKKSLSYVLPVFEGDKFVGVVTHAAIADYLYEYRRELEEAISKRTSELQAANEQLQQEIHERGRGEEVLRQASAYTRSLIEASLDPLATISREGEITDVNEATIKATGMPREKLIGTDFSDYFTEPQKARSGYQEVLSKGCIVDYPLTIRHTKTGKLTPVLYNASVYRDEAGKVQGVFAAARDITELEKAKEALQRACNEMERRVEERTAELAKTNQELKREIKERKQAEEALRGSEGKLAGIIASITDHMSMMDDDYNIVWANGVARELFGPDLVGKKCYRAYHGYDKPCKPCVVKKCFEDGQVHEHETEVIGADGSNMIFWCTASVAAWHRDGRPRMVVEVSQNITDRKRAEEAARKAYDQLEERVRERTAELAARNEQLELEITERQRAEDALKKSREQLRALTARLSQVETDERQALARHLHDQAGPRLTALGINLNIVQAQMPKEAPNSVRSRLEDSTALIGETTKIIRNVMAELYPEVLDDYGLLAALHWYGKQFCDRTRIPIKVRGKEPTPRLPTVVGRTLFRIAEEALTNIAKHARARKVTIILKEIGEMVQVIIDDNGVGFDLAAGSKSKKQPGWGLIAMEERAVALGGQLRVESKPGKGTRIIIEVRR